MTDLIRIGPGDPRYEDLRVRGDNKRFTAEPDSFVLATSTAQVAAAVEEAVRTGARVAVRSGGHGFEDHTGGARVVIDLDRMNQVGFDERRQAFVVEPGVRLLDLYRTLYLGYGVTVPGGASGQVGFGGHVLGGGCGPLSRRFGICADHLEAIEVVVVDEDRRVRTVVATRDPTDDNHDLWWAHTGAGGGNFGIVTRYWLRSPGATGAPGQLLPQPPPTVVTTSTIFPRDGLGREALRTLIGNYGRWHERHSAPGSPEAAMFNGLVLFGRPGQDDQGIGAILFQHLNDEDLDRGELIEQARAEITAGVAAPFFPMPVQRQPWLSTTAQLAKLQDADVGRTKVKSAFLRRGWSVEQIDAVHEHLWGTGHRFDSATISLQSFGGAINAVGSEATAHSHRDSVLLAIFQTSWSDPDADEANLDWTRRLFHGAYRSTGGVPVPNRDNGGSYINFPDVDLADPRWNTSGVSWQELYFRENLPRLQQTKKRWDPLTVFSHALSVE